jgi:lysine biosynthesis protein LysW
MARAICPGCKRSLDLDRYLEVGEFVHCPRCRADLEVTRLHPLTLEWVDEWFEGATLSSTQRANGRWLNRDKRTKRKARARFSEDFHEFD